MWRQRRRGKRLPLRRPSTGVDVVDHLIALLTGVLVFLLV
jgi:hypothetical protein